MPEGPAAALLVVSAATLWGTAGAAQELGPPGISPVAVAALRALVGGGLLVAVVLALRGSRPLGAVWQRAPAAAAVAAVAMGLFQLGYLGGIRLTGVAVGTLVAIGSAPVTAGLLDLARGRAPDRRWVVGTAVTLAGTGLLVAPGGGSTVRPAGVALGLLAGAAYATYAVSSKRMLDLGVEPTPAMAGAFAGAALLLAPLLAFVDLGWVATPRGVAVAVWLCAVTITVAYVLFARGLQGVQAATATTLTLAEPLTAAVLGVLVLGERPGGPAAAGALLVALGLVLTGRGRRTPTPGRRGLRRRA